MASGAKYYNETKLVACKKNLVMSDNVFVRTRQLYL